MRREELHSSKGRNEYYVVGHLDFNAEKNR